jgi:hypothetical protein
MNNTTFGDESCGYYETVAGGAGAVSQYLNSRDLILRTLNAMFFLGYIVKKVFLLSVCKQKASV